MIDHFANWGGALLSAVGLFFGMLIEWARVRRRGVHW